MFPDIFKLKWTFLEFIFTNMLSLLDSHKHLVTAVLLLCFLLFYSLITVLAAQYRLRLPQVDNFVYVRMCARVRQTSLVSLKNQGTGAANVTLCVCGL